MEASKDTTTRLCEMCSTLDMQRMTHPLHPCRNPLPCSSPPVEERRNAGLVLGSIDEIKSRRSTCDICNLIAESLDKEPPELSGECRIIDSAEFCNFQLPRGVQARDPSVTHFHLTQASVIFDTTVASQFFGPSLPWELQDRDTRSTHYILDLQVSRNQVVIDLMLNGQIKARPRSCVETGCPTTASPQTEQEFLDAIGGRYVYPQVNIQLIRAWLHQCESEHGEDCMPSLRLQTEQDREPTFVVDVIQSCLVDAPLRCRYVTLSYVWGTAPVFRHLLENTQDLRKTGSLRSLPIPATIRDAMTLVRAIGERYLWVDSLCIIQDDLKMQQAEIARMGSIYSRALFTIIAAAGDHANSGLPGVEQGSREQVQKILKLLDYELLTAIDIRRTPSGIDGTTWAQRAWTFQERMLSSRVLVFSENQVYWNCCVASQSEERALEGIRDINRLHLPFPRRPTGDNLPWKSLQPSEYRGIWGDLLSSYRERHLTYQTDTLNAFDGISEVLAALQNDTFFWGLPESHFTYALTWYLTGYFARNFAEISVINSKGRKETIPIPSWSWAAWAPPDPNQVFHFHPGNGHDVRAVVHFNIVNGKHQLVRIKEPPYQGHQDNRIRALWKHEESHQLQSPVQRSLFQIGQLHFWTSFANLRAIRHWSFQGQGEVQYTPFPPPNFRPDPNPDPYSPEIVDQDFIVVAASGPERLILLAIEWRDGVAYRVGQAEITEKSWVGVENRQWRLITLG